MILSAATLQFARACRFAAGMSLFVSIFFVSIFFCGAPAYAAPTKHATKFANIVSDGKIDADIITGDSPEELSAAKLLRDTLEKMADKINVEIKTAAPRDGKNLTIYLSKSSTSPQLNATTADIDATQTFAFNIFENSIHIEYPSDASALNAVGLFLRKFCDVRFFVPSEIGSEIPKTENLKIRAGTYRVNPSFKGRFLGLYQARVFAEAIGHNDDFIAENHNLNQIINSDIAKEHPHWLAEIDGVRQPYTKAAQIDFLNGGARLFTKRYVDDYFAKKPDAKIISLSPADSSDFDSTHDSMRMSRGSTPNGYTDYSNLVFGFTNDIARHLKKNAPEKFVYSLAYINTESAPSFPLEDNVIVYLCEDRGNYFSPQYREKSVKLLEDWRDNGAKFLGIYDYNYGAHYFIPRNTYEQISDSIKTSYEIGARFYTCEFFPNWAYDAHKIWAMSNLLIDIDADSQKLRRDFFDAYYKESAAPVSSFFETAQAQWNMRTDKPLWLSLFKRDSQAEIFTPDALESMEADLKTAEKTAENKIVQYRIKELRMMFDITKSFIRTYELQKKLWLYGAPSEENKSAILDTIEAVKISKSTKKVYLERYNRDTKYPKTDFSIWNALDYMDASEMRLAQIENMYLPRGKNILKESDLKNAFSKNKSFWKGVEGKNAHLKIENSGNWLNISSWLPTYLYQEIPVVGGKKYAFEINLDGNLDVGTVFYAELSFYDARGKVLSRKRLRLPSIKDFKNLYMRIDGVASQSAKSAVVALFAISMRDSDFVKIKRAELLEK